MITARPKGEKSARLSSCNRISSFSKSLSRLFHNLGFLIGTHPVPFIILPIVLSCLASAGLLYWFKEESDHQKLFVPEGSRALQEKRAFDDFYRASLPKSQEVIKSRKTKDVLVIIKSKDGGSIFKINLWKEIFKLDNSIRNLKTSYDGNVSCYKERSNDILRLAKGLIENKEIMPILLYPTAKLLLVLGKPEFDAHNSTIVSAKAVTLNYYLGSCLPNGPAHSVEDGESLNNLIHGSNFKEIEVSFYTSDSYAKEMTESGQIVLWYLKIQLAVMAIFATLSASRLDWVRGKSYIGVVGMLSTGLATIFSFGLMMVFGVPHTSLNMAIPFLMLGIGLDDMFVVLSAWQRTNIKDRVAVRMAATYSESAVSITITSLTDFISFLIGYFTPFPGIKIFCLYAGTSILATYLWFLFLFGGCLSIAGRLEESQRHTLLPCKKVKSRSQSEGKSLLYKAFCSGGINHLEPTHPLDNKPYSVAIFCRDILGEAISRPMFKVLILLLFVVYISGAVYGFTQLKEGEVKNHARYNSPLWRFIEDREKLYGKYKHQLKFLINEPANYSDPETRRRILDLHASFEETRFTTNLFTRSVIREFYQYLDERPEDKERAKNESEFISMLRNEFRPFRETYSREVIFNKNSTRILASSFKIWSQDTYSIHDEINMSKKLREIADNASFKVVMKHMSFIYLDQLIVVRSTSLQTIIGASVVMILVSFLFVPSPLSALCIGLTIISVEVGVIGYMALLGANLDCMILVELIMCIGFSVDFSTHISYAYLTSKSQFPRERMKECLFKLGPPIIQGGLSTMAGVSLLAFPQSYVFTTFLKVVVLVIVFGMFHALLILPIFLSMFDTAKEHRDKRGSLEIQHRENLESENTVPFI